MSTTTTTTSRSVEVERFEGMKEDIGRAVARLKAGILSLVFGLIAGTGLFAMTRWTESEMLASTFAHAHKAKGLINPGGHVYRLRLKGKLKNEDIILGAA